ncbi:hypothetical protein HAX54_023806, partial [Datura stramonium]|nr:hypothetical protein [Datura stramonium]
TRNDSHWMTDNFSPILVDSHLIPTTDIEGNIQEPGLISNPLEESITDITPSNLGESVTNGIPSSQE